MKLSICICATEKYTYAMTAQARRVQTAAAHLAPGHIILSGDKSLNPIKLLYEDLMPGWQVHVLDHKTITDGHKNYNDQAQLVIAQLRTAAFSKARALNSDQCWSLDSDVLPTENSLRSMQEVISIFDGYYSVGFCPYPSQGGGGFLGGFGSPYKQIFDDFNEEERILPDALKSELDAFRAQTEEIVKAGKNPFETKERQEQAKDLDKKVRECPPTGNVYALNAKKWRRRGWFDQVYPAIGKGAIVPVTWVGFGCTLMNRKALAVSHFDGYSGKGTEDLYIGWQRWHQEGLRIGAIPHCPCDHVIRNPGKPGAYVHQQAYHETEGECIGHLRMKAVPFYSHDAGEKYSEENDGKMIQPKAP